MMIKTNTHKQITYSKFTEIGGLKRIRKAKTAIVDLEIEILKKRFNCDTKKDNYLSYVQKVVSYAFNSKMVVNIAHQNYHGKKVGISIPKRWHTNFQNELLPVNYLTCQLKWSYLLSLLIVRSLSQAFMSLITPENFTLNNLILNQRASNKKIVMLNPKFPKGNVFIGEPSLDFTNWYCKKFMLDKDFTFLSFDSRDHESVAHVSNKQIECIQLEAFQFGISFVNRLKLLKYSLALLFKGTFNLLLASPSILVNYNELILARRLTYVPRNELPDFVIFSDNHGILKPCWANSLNDRGAIVQYFFFSSYDSPTRYKDENPRQDFWKLNNWPNIYCVDAYQRDFISNNLYSKTQKVEIIGFPYFTDSQENLIKSKKPSIALFDFEPGINNFGSSTLSEFQFNTYKFNEVFMSIVCDVASDSGFIVLHKPKRQITVKNRPRKYQSFLDALDSDVYFSIAPDTSPARLIMNTNCTIAMPITSPGIIAGTLGKESVFFDPYGVIDEEDQALRGVSLVKNAHQLKEFLEGIKDKMLKCTKVL